MVWPILISVDVTPRISAAAATEIRTATALRIANPRTKRIDALPLPALLRRAQGGQPGAVVRALATIKTCHAAGMDAKHKKTRRRRRVFDFQ
jgi:hypothetical protein